MIERMTAPIRHRGPDDSGIFQDAHASLGFRRLAIIDVAGGHQPMANEDRSCWIVFNGEIFNHADLRPALEAAGHRYETRSDTETILHAYEQYGAGCVEKLRGMFGFAIWETHRRRLFLARDRLGKKPIYYFWNGRLLVFGSEIKALLAHPDLSAEFDDSLLPEYLAFGYTSDDRTFFRNVRKLLPGHHLTLDLADPDPSPVIAQYWDIPEPPASGRGEVRDDAAWIGECRERLEETVRMRLMSDVPLGMFLSGGVDSSAIAAIMKRNITGPVKTFAVGYSEAEYSELSYARHVAEAIGTEHHEVTVSMEEFFNALPRLIWHEDEPITWPSSVSLFFVSQLARQHVTVVLTGEGSDEMFGGYARYRHYSMNERWLRRYRMVPGPLRRMIRAQVATTPLLSGPNSAPCFARCRRGRRTPISGGTGTRTMGCHRFRGCCWRTRRRTWWSCS
jgi:asparagine synthase (glutamine-hydrolysing)